jgi:hypothetical protein
MFWAALAPRTTNTGRLRSSCSSFWSTSSPSTQVTAYMAHEHSLHGVIQGLLLLALLWETWAGYTWLGMARPT